MAPKVQQYLFRFMTIFETCGEQGERKSSQTYCCARAKQMKIQTNLPCFRSFEALVQTVQLFFHPELPIKFEACDLL